MSKNKFLNLLNSIKQDGVAFVKKCKAELKTVLKIIFIQVFEDLNRTQS